MSHEVVWNKIVLEEFVKIASLTDEEEMILRTRVAGWSRTKQSAELSISLSTVDRIIKSLKIKYDDAQKYSELLPPRKIKENNDETFMGFDSFLKVNNEECDDKMKTI